MAIKCCCFAWNSLLVDGRLVRWGGAAGEGEQGSCIETCHPSRTIAQRRRRQDVPTLVSLFDAGRTAMAALASFSLNATTDTGKGIVVTALAHRRAKDTRAEHFISQKARHANRLDAQKKMHYSHGILSAAVLCIALEKQLGPAGPSLYGSTVIPVPHASETDVHPRFSVWLEKGAAISESTLLNEKTILDAMDADMRESNLAIHGELTDRDSDRLSFR